MRRHERWWFTLRNKPAFAVVFLPYWMVKMPVFVLAIILRHALERRADRLRS